ncbi:hypothetical protein MUK42_13195 [Musa troglodytarum]|uniref:Uncharacterized protein n=1 Tax=Musa troglodytarum TaxID=320322 RepID=A0A9E7G1K5_9LILI|nr:hypothetical protein MUK42_13195 [Musa troglodytarum]
MLSTDATPTCLKPANLLAFESVGDLLRILSSSHSLFGMKTVSFCCSKEGGCMHPLCQKADAGPCLHELEMGIFTHHNQS